MPDYIVEAKTVQTSAIRTLTEALKCILVEMSLLLSRRREGMRSVLFSASVNFIM
jgi:hypothetical protein